MQSFPRNILTWLILIASFTIFGEAAAAQTTTFTYQGKLTDNGVSANGTYQFQFALFDALVNGNQISSTITNSSVQVSGGVFTVDLDFGAGVFSGAPRYLQISVFSPATSTYVTLDPRQRISNAPYAIRALSSDTATQADDSTRLGGVPASEFVQTSNPALTDAREPLPGSANYVQNTTNPQTSSNFNIDGTGTADTLNAKTQFSINGTRFLSGGPAGTDNVFVGKNTGSSIVIGNNNVAVGLNSGRFITNGSSNTFLGAGSGFGNSVGNNNSAVGTLAGVNNVNGSDNSLFGYSSGVDSTGSGNSFFGSSSGLSNTSGSNNTLIGSGTNVGASNLTNATAIGSGAVVSASNSIVLGRNAGQDSVVIPGNLMVNGTLTADLSAGYIRNTSTLQPSSNFAISGNGSVGDTLFTNKLWVNSSGTLGSVTVAGGGSFGATVSANIVKATAQFNLNNTRFLSSPGTNNLFVGANTGSSLSTGSGNVFVGSGAGQANTSGGNNTFVGFAAGQSVTSGFFDSFFGANAGKATTGVANSFFGASAGTATTTGAANSFFGNDAGKSNTTGAGNSFFGTGAGSALANGNQNSFFGSTTGPLLTSGSNNSFVGNNVAQNLTSGSDNVFIGSNVAVNLSTGSGNTLIGTGTDVGGNVSNSTAIGTGAIVSQSNAIVLGTSDVNLKVGISTTTPKAKLEVALGDVYVSSAATGMILKAPNGTCWRVTVGNAGTLTSTSVVCP